MKKAGEKMPQIFTPEKKAEIKAQLLKEGREMMLERGITGMDIEELAASAGVSQRVCSITSFPLDKGTEDMTDALDVPLI